MVDGRLVLVVDGCEHLRACPAAILTAGGEDVVTVARGGGLRWVLANRLRALCSFCSRVGDAMHHDGREYISRL